MKKTVLILFATILFSYELGVKEKDIPALRDLGLLCEQKGDYCVFARGSNKEELLKIQKYIQTNAAIPVVFIDETKKSAVKKAEIKKTPAKPEAIKGVYSLQFISARNLNEAKKVFEKHKNLPFVRIEKVGKFYTVRAGAFKSYKEAKKIKNGIVLKCNILPERIIEIKNENGYFSKR